MKVKELTAEVKKLKDQIATLEGEQKTKDEKLKTQEQTLVETQAETSRQLTLLSESESRVEQEVSAREKADAGRRDLEVHRLSLLLDGFSSS